MRRRRKMNLLEFMEYNVIREFFYASGEAQGIL